MYKRQNTDNAVSTSHTYTRAHTHRRTQPILRLCHIVTPCMVTLVTPRLRQIRLRRLRQTRLRHIVTPRGYAGYATVTPNSVTPYSYATWLRRLRHRLRQIRLRHIVTPHVVTPRLRQIRLRHMVTPVTPRLRQIRLRHIVTPRGYAGYAIGYAKFGYAT